jgi:hypothetical protein
MDQFIFNGAAVGDVASALLHAGMDPGVLRPYIGAGGRTYITRNGKAVLARNATATMRYEDWRQLDSVVLKAARPRLKFVADVRQRGLEYGIGNGMGKTVLSTETLSDINDADISMDGLTQTQGDRPVSEIGHLPLPIISKDFSYSAREIAVSQSGGTPLDTTTAEMAGRKVAEQVEKLALGVASSYTYGGGTVYGATNYTNALTKTMTAPTASGWAATTTVEEVLAMRGQSQAAYYYGPWMLYTSPSWDAYLDNDYSAAKGDNTLRQRLAAIEGIEGVRTLDYLTGYKMLLIQMTSEVIRMVVGMEIMTIQWETVGGLRRHFKVMCILVPQFRADQNGNTGLVYGST